MNQQKVLIKLDGQAILFGWSDLLQTYNASIDFTSTHVDLQKRYIGTAFSEYLTIDFLTNYLKVLGLKLDSTAKEQLISFRDRQDSIIGESTIKATGYDDRPQIDIKTPNGAQWRLQNVSSRSSWRWGDQSNMSNKTALSLYLNFISPVFSISTESFAYKFCYDFLSEINSNFEISINSICDWYLTDSELRYRTF